MLAIQGQPRAIAQLQRSLRAARLASTWIFAGPQGVGKFSLAVELAKTKLCDHPLKKKNNELGEQQNPLLPDDFPLTLPCNACESCRAIAMNGGGSHPDLHIITKELIRMHDRAGTSKGTNLSIHVIRGEITGDPAAGKEPKIAKRPFRGRGKFFIIDEADLMDPPAQNALLKSLEEPPPDTYLILITASPGDLLSTIQSRSQLVQFSALPVEFISSRLIGAGMGREDAALLARLGGGSLGRALRWSTDIRTIDEKNTKAAERKAKADQRNAASDSPDEPDEDTADSTNKFTPGGILTWTRQLTATLDNLVAGRAAASDVAALISQYAAEYSALQLFRDKLASADRAKRDGIALLLSIAADYFADRLRQGLGTPHTTPLPAQTAALDHALVPQLIASARAAELQIDQNANEKILLAATTTQWEFLLHQNLS